LVFCGKEKFAALPSNLKGPGEPGHWYLPPLPLPRPFFSDLGPSECETSFLTPGGSAVSLIKLDATNIIPRKDL